MARGALQVVGHRPVILELELLAHQVRDHGRHAAELRMAEGVAQPGVGHELAIGAVQALGHADHAVAGALHGRVHLGEEPVLVERDFGEQQDVRRLARALAASPQAAVIQPAWRPITSSTNTRVEVFAMDATS